VTGNVYCLVKVIQKDERSIAAAVQFEIKLLIFFYQSKQLTDYIYTDIYCKVVNYRNALDRLHVRMNIILFLTKPCQISTKFHNFWQTGSQDNRIM